MSANLELDLFKLRLLVGQRVECLVEDDKWIPGRIEQVGPDKYHVYSAILDDGSRVLCPVDEDLCVREYADEKEDYIFRLDVGDRVRCRVETGLVTGWSRGTVVRHLYREQEWPENKWVPYQVLLDDGLTSITLEMPRILNGNTLALLHLRLEGITTSQGSTQAVRVQFFVLFYMKKCNTQYQTLLV